ncbi:hypothetical protein F350042L8_33160 [Fusobacterium ulcerans]|uniref:hypothetical protein n=1 Tax=Fusobacterium ulcerans TaxID=861 RepID=UPI0034C2C5E8
MIKAIIVLASVIVLGFVISLFVDSIEKMSFKCIVRDYLKTFYDYDTKKKSQKDMVLFIIFPILLGIAFGNFIFLTREFINTLLIIFSILLGLMLNLLILILSKKSKKETINKLNTELFHSISFSILISIFIVISSLFFSFDITFIKEWDYYLTIKKIASMWSYSLIFLFCMDLFLILKRIHILLAALDQEESLEKNKNSKKENDIG